MMLFWIDVLLAMDDVKSMDSGIRALAVGEVGFKVEISRLLHSLLPC